MYLILKVLPQVSISSSFLQAFFVWKSFLAAFSSYVLALVKNSYKKCARLTLMKFTAAINRTKLCFSRFQNLLSLIIGSIWKMHLFLKRKSLKAKTENKVWWNWILKTYFDLNGWNLYLPYSLSTLKISSASSSRTYNCGL